MANARMHHCYQYPFFTVYFISDQVDEISAYEGESFALKYQTSQPQSDIKIYKDGTFIKSAKTMFILKLKIANGGLYHAECHCVRSKSTSLTVLRKYVRHTIHVTFRKDR